MVNLIKSVAVILLVLSALIAAVQGCQIAVSSQLQTVQDNYNVYTGTIANVGSDAALNVLLTTDAAVRKVSGLEEKHEGYELSQKVVSEGGIAAGASVTFKYKAKKGTTVVWTASCTDDASVPPTAAATSRPKEPTAKATSKATTTTTTTTTTVAPKKGSKTTTTQAAKTTTQAPAKTTTQAPAKTTTQAPAKTTTQAPAKSPTTAPTSAPTKATTTAAASASGKRCPGLSWWAPTPLTTWQWQLTGTIDTSIDVQMYDIDLFDNTADTIAELHSQGRIVICYFSTQYENWRPDASSFTSAVIGNALDGWAGENYVDIRSPIVRNIMVERMNLAVSKGCDGVEPDNVDGYENNSGFPVTAADQLNFNEFIATSAHAVGLSVGLKNDVDQGKTLEPFFDWALDEQCKQYDECDTLSSFITAGKAVFECEYSGTAASVCPYMVGIQFSSLIKTLDLTAKITAQCCTDQPGGCAAIASYQCVTSMDYASKKRSLNEEENVTVQDNFVAQQQLQQQQGADKVSAAPATTFASIAFVVIAASALLSL